jgi:hypothetical protein
VTEGKRRIDYVTREAFQSALDRVKKLAQVRKSSGIIPKKITRPRVIREMRGEIAAALKKGHEIEDIVAAICLDGIDIDVQAFREYWRQAKRKRRVTATHE